MPKSQRALQKKQAAKNAKRKLRLKKIHQLQGQSEYLSAIKRCSRGAFHECYISEGIRAEQFGTILFSRHSAGEPGQIGFAAILIDNKCLGVKNCYFRVGPLSRFQDHLESLRRNEILRPAAPEVAAKIIQGAIAYARGCGIAPDSDFGPIQHLFADLDPSLCQEEFIHGVDGKPLFVQGPFDSPQRISRIMKTLQNKLGPDGFNFMLDLSGMEEDD